MSQCKFRYRAALVLAKQCQEESCPGSEYCVWHDQRSKKGELALASRLENAIFERHLSTEGFCLRDASLRGLHLHRQELIAVVFDGADLTHASLRESDLSQSTFRGTLLSGADLTECRLVRANLQGAKLDFANCSGANLEDAIVDGATHAGTHFGGAFLDGTPWSSLSARGPSTNALLERYSPNPFTPKAGLIPRWMGGRNEAKRTLTQLLGRAAEGSNDHVVVLGDWAMGKTALLLWLRGEAQQRGVWASYTPIPKYDNHATVGATVSGLVEGILRGFAPGISSVKQFARTVTEVGFSVVGTGLSVEREPIPTQPMTMLTDCLVSLWADLKTKSPCVALLIDDADQLRPGAEVLSVIKQSLATLAAASDARFLVVLSAVPKEWQSLVGPKGHSPIGRYFSAPPVELRKLPFQEARQVVTRTLDGTGVRFDPSILKRALEFANGHPYDLQIICSTLYEAQMAGAVTEQTWTKAKADAERWLNRVTTKHSQRRDP